MLWRQKITGAPSLLFFLSTFPLYSNEKYIVMNFTVFEIGDKSKDFLTAENVAMRRVEKERT